MIEISIMKWLPFEMEEILYYMFGGFFFFLFLKKSFMMFYIKVKIVFVFFMSILCSLLIYTPRKIWLSSPSTRSIGQYWTKSRTYTQKNQTILDYGINVINETIYTRTDLLLLVSPMDDRAVTTTTYK
jgi:hypothetical protein